MYTNESILFFLLCLGQIMCMYVFESDVQNICRYLLSNYTCVISTPFFFVWYIRSKVCLVRKSAVISTGTGTKMATKMVTISPHG